LFVLQAAKGVGYATNGKTWTLNHPPLRNLQAQTELANCTETHLANEPLIAGLIYLFSIPKDFTTS
jgi:hypothetical protein